MGGLGDTKRGTALSISGQIDASNPGAGAALNALLEIVRSHGGDLHPATVLIERDGNLSVRCTRGTVGGPEGADFVTLPRELLVPIDGAEWSDSDDELALRRHPSGTSTVQRSLLELFIELYQATQKLHTFAHNHPMLALRAFPSVVEAIRAVRPSFRCHGSSAADAFLSTRVFRERARQNYDTAVPVLQGVGTNDPRPVLIPIIDSLNHHELGAGFNLDSQSMRIKIARPEGSDECFASYGTRRDHLDLALHYGYLDRSTTVVRSAPVQVDLRGHGVLRVRGRPLVSRHHLDPPLIQEESDGLSVSHITFDANRPGAALMGVRMALLGFARKHRRSQKEATALADEAIERVILENRRALQGIRDEVRKTCLAHAYQPALHLVEDATARQLETLTLVETRLAGSLRSVRIAGVEP